MAKRKKEKRDDKGLLLLLLGAGAAAAAIFGKKAPTTGANLGVLAVEFHSPGNFYPGSQHEVVVTIKNSGNASADIGTNTINIIPDVGVTNLLLPTTIAPGQTVAGRNYFTISPLAIPGSQNVWTLSVRFDGSELVAGPTDAFMVEMPPAPFLELVPPVQFT